MSFADMSEIGIPQICDKGFYSELNWGGRNMPEDLGSIDLT